MLRIRNILLVSKNEDDGVLASFKIQIDSEHGVQQFWAEARKCPNAEAQIDWSDDLSDLLAEYSATREAYDQINQSIFSTFIGEVVEYPIHLAQAT